MSELDLKSEIVHLVKARDHVTFVEIKKHLADKMSVNGHKAVTMAHDPNLILWPGLNSKLADTITELLNENKIFPHPTTMVTYIVDGGVPILPLAKHPPSHGYKRPHWLPVCFRLVPPKSLIGKIARNHRSKLLPAKTRKKEP